MKSDTIHASKTLKKCPQCGQELKFPERVGGMLMACPKCGQKFHSDFILSNVKSRGHHQGRAAKIFGLPYELLLRILRLFSRRH